MNTTKYFLATVFGLLIIGCSKDSSSPTGQIQSPAVSVSPADGATAVRLDAGITLTFAKPVDRTVVERNTHLISNQAMDDSLCPAGYSMGHGMMNMENMSHGRMDSIMMDSTKTNHFMSRHITNGSFVWNSDNTQCTFLPDSMMLPSMQYMFHMGREMISMMEDRMGSMNAMNAHGTGMMSNDMMVHFSTMDITNTGGGHDGHH